MAVHDRLRPPTLEQSPVRRGNGLPLALALVIFAAGFAYAMPRMQNTSAEGTVEEPEVVVVQTPVATATPTATPTPEPTEEPEDDGEDGEHKADNHGKAVSTAAHCDIKGKAHGELVRSIAKDKDATVADAEAACAAALAAQEASESTEGSKTKPEKSHSRPDKEPKPHKTVEPAPSDDGTDDDSSDEGHGKPDKPEKPPKP
jgi:hypothetical protein